MTKIGMACLALWLFPVVGYACEDIKIIKETCRGSLDCLKWFADRHEERLVLDLDEIDRVEPVEVSSNDNPFMYFVMLDAQSNVRASLVANAGVQNAVLLLGWEDSQEHRQEFQEEQEQREEMQEQIDEQLILFAEQLKEKIKLEFPNYAEYEKQYVEYAEQIERRKEKIKQAKE